MHFLHVLKYRICNFSINMDLFGPIFSVYTSKDVPIVLIFIPDGHSKEMHKSGAKEQAAAKPPSKKQEKKSAKQGA